MTLAKKGQAWWAPAWREHSRLEKQDWVLFCASSPFKLHAACRKGIRGPWASHSYAAPGDMKPRVAQPALVTADRPSHQPHPPLLREQGPNKLLPYPYVEQKLMGSDKSEGDSPTTHPTSSRQPPPKLLIYSINVRCQPAPPVPNLQAPTGVTQYRERSPSVKGGPPGEGIPSAEGSPSWKQ